MCYFNFQHAVYSLLAFSGYNIFTRDPIHGVVASVAVNHFVHFYVSCTYSNRTDAERSVKIQNMSVCCTLLLAMWTSITSFAVSARSRPCFPFTLRNFCARIWGPRSEGVGDDINCGVVWRFTWRHQLLSYFHSFIMTFIDGMHRKIAIFRIFFSDSGTTDRWAGRPMERKNSAQQLSGNQYSTPRVFLPPPAKQHTHTGSLASLNPVYFTKVPKFTEQ